MEVPAMGVEAPAMGVKAPAPHRVHEEREREPEPEREQKPTTRGELDTQREQTGQRAAGGGR